MCRVHARSCRSGCKKGMGASSVGKLRICGANMISIPGGSVAEGGEHVVGNAAACASVLCAVIWLYYVAEIL
jgi:hypothetical protein